MTHGPENLYYQVVSYSNNTLTVKLLEYLPNTLVVTTEAQDGTISKSSVDFNPILDQINNRLTAIEGQLSS